MRNSKISLVIPTFRRVETLRKTIDSLLKSERLPDEVLIIDQTELCNGADLIKRECERIPNAIYLRSETPSLTKARNVGLKHASGEIIVFMDDDVDVRKETFASVSKIMSEETISMIGGLDVNSCCLSSRSSRLFCKASRRKSANGYVTNAVYGRFPDAMPVALTETEWAMGFFFVIRRSLAQKWHLEFDENLKYYAYAEDLDFTYAFYRKSKQENLKCVMSPEIIVKHNVSQEYRLISLKAYTMIYAHREYLRKKHFNNFSGWLATRWSNFGDIVMSILRNGNASDIFKAQRFVAKHRKDILKGNFHYEEFMC